MGRARGGEACAPGWGSRDGAWRGGASSVWVWEPGWREGVGRAAPPGRLGSPAGSPSERIPGSARSPGHGPRGARPASPPPRGHRAASCRAPRSGRAQRQAEESLDTD